MITIDLIDEYVSEHEKQAASRQAPRPGIIRRVFNTVLNPVASQESSNRRSLRALDSALAEPQAGLLLWKRG